MPEELDMCAFSSSLRAPTDRHFSHKERACGVTLAEPFHGNTAQLLDNRSDCNNHPFIATLFCGLAIIYLSFRKFVSSLWHIPLPQPVGTDTQQRNNKPGHVAAFLRKMYILLQITGRIQVDSVAKKKPQKTPSKCHLGVCELEQSLQGVWSNASILHSTDNAAAVASPTAFGLGHSISRKRQISWEVPRAVRRIGGFVNTVYCTVLFNMKKLEMDLVCKKLL